MAVYVDALLKWPKSRKWRWPTACHMVADTDTELHAFADRIGLKRTWHQISDGGLSHYDLNESRRKAAVNAGAIEIDRETLVFKFIRPARERMQRTQGAK
jgi:hypothetical protein